MDPASERNRVAVDARSGRDIQASAEYGDVAVYYPFHGNVATEDNDIAGRTRNSRRTAETDNVPGIFVCLHRHVLTKPNLVRAVTGKCRNSRDYERKRKQYNRTNSQHRHSTPPTSDPKENTTSHRRWFRQHSYLDEDFEV